MSLLTFGSRRLLRALRSGNVARVVLWGALAGISLAHRLRRPERKLLYARTLGPGDALRIRTIGSEDQGAP